MNWINSIQMGETVRNISRGTATKPRSALLANKDCIKIEHGKEWECEYPTLILRSSAMTATSRKNHHHLECWNIDNSLQAHTWSRRVICMKKFDCKLWRSLYRQIGTAQTLIVLLLPKRELSICSYKMVPRAHSPNSTHHRTREPREHHILFGWNLNFKQKNMEMIVPWKHSWCWGRVWPWMRCTCVGQAGKLFSEYERGD